MKHAVTMWVGALLVVACCNSKSMAEELRPSVSDISVTTGSIPDRVWSLRRSNSPDSVPGSLMEIVYAEDPALAPDTPLRSFIGGFFLENDTLRSTQHEYRASLQAKKESVFNLLPTVSLQFDTGRTSSINAFKRRNTSDYETASLNLDWTVFSSGTSWAQIKASSFAAEAARFQAIGAERRLLLETLNIYLELLAASKQVTALEKSRASMRKVLKGAKSQFAAGFSSRTDIAQIENELAEIQILLEQANNQFEEQRVRWKGASGNDAITPPAWPSVANLIPDTQEATVQKALENNPHTAAAENSAQSEKYRARAAMAGFLPRIDLYGQVSRDLELNQYEDREVDYQVGVRLTVPLVNLAASSRYSRSKELAIAAKYRARDTERLVRTEVSTGWLKLQSLGKQEKLIRTRISKGQEIRTGLIKEYHAGLRPVSDYLRQEIELAQLEQDLINNRITKTNIAWQILMYFDTASIKTMIQ